MMDQVCARAGETRAHYAQELYRVGAIVLGAEGVTAWRPLDARLRTIVEVVAHAHAHGADVGVVVDALREVDPHFAWSPVLHSAMVLYDRAVDKVDRATRLASAQLLVEAAIARAGDAWMALGSATDDLHTALRLAAETATQIAREIDRDV